MAKTDLTAERLRELLHYDPEAGVFTRRTNSNNKARIGDVAGHRTAKDYWSIKISGVAHSAHRLAWLYVYGAWPREGVDHANGIKTDNRIANLREATHSENMQNKKAKDGLKDKLGTYYRKDNDKWASEICFNGHRKYLLHLMSSQSASKSTG